jgi:hypothetical protein
MRLRIVLRTGEIKAIRVLRGVCVDGDCDHFSSCVGLGDRTDGRYREEVSFEEWSFRVSWGSSDYSALGLVLAMGQWAITGVPWFARARESEGSISRCLPCRRYTEGHRVAGGLVTRAVSSGRVIW